jgi:hypothetical protein
MEQRRERIVVLTPRHRIEGELTLPREGYRSRLSDYLNHGDITFLALSDAELTELGRPDAAPQRRRFVAVNVGQIELAHPAED